MKKNFNRFTKSVSVVALIMCGGMISFNLAANQYGCPPPGTKVPFLKIMALPKDFVGCDIETEATFYTTGWGTFSCMSAPVRGKAQFQVTELGGNPQATPFGAVGFLALVDKSVSDPLFESRPGDTLILRGGTHFHDFGEADGQGDACFIATSVRKK